MKKALLFSLFTVACSVSSAQNNANLWIDTDGGTCTRSSTPAAYDTTRACASFSDAYNAASGGDVIYVRAGTYGAQTVPSRSIGSSIVTIAQDPGGGTVTVSSLQVNSSNVTVDGVTIATSFGLGSNPGCSATPGNGWPCAFPTKNVLLKNFTARNGFITGDTITIQHGSIGPMESCAVSDAEDGLVLLGAGNGVNSSWTPSVNITVDDVTIHDITNNGCGKHTDGIQGYGYRKLTVKNSRIYNTDSSLILAYSFDNSNPGQVDTVTIENNVFGAVPHPGHGITLGNDGSAPCGSNNLNNVIQNNTFYGYVMADVNCAGSQDAIFRNNVVLGSEACGYGAHEFSWDYNIFPVSGAGSGCTATTHAKACSPAFVSLSTGNVDLSASDVCAKDYVPASSGAYPLTDRHGTPRPQGSAVDAGAFEVVTTSSTQPPTNVTATAQ